MHKESLIVCKRKMKEDGLDAAAIVLEYDPTKKERVTHKIVSIWRALWAFMEMTKANEAPWLFTNWINWKDFRHCQEKLESTVSLLEKIYKAQGPQEIHWYIKCVAVSPECIGQGLGRELMVLINNLADERGVTSYLECGSTKVGFYEKMGYTVSGTYMRKTLWTKRWSLFKLTE